MRPVDDQGYMAFQRAFSASPNTIQSDPREVKVHRIAQMISYGYKIPFATAANFKGIFDGAEYGTASFARDQAK